MKSPPDPWARDFPPFFQLFATSRTLQIFTAILLFVCQLGTKPSLFGRVFTVLRNNCRWLKSPPGRRVRVILPFSQRFATSRTIQTWTTNLWMHVPTQNLFQLIREGFYYIQKFFLMVEKHARTSRWRFSTVFPAPRYEWYLSNINYKFSNACADSKPIPAY